MLPTSLQRLRYLAPVALGGMPYSSCRLGSDCLDPGFLSWAAIWCSVPVVDMHRYEAAVHVDHVQSFHLDPPQSCDDASSGLLRSLGLRAPVMSWHFGTVVPRVVLDSDGFEMAIMEE